MYRNASKPLLFNSDYIACLPVLQRAANVPVVAPSPTASLTRHSNAGYLIGNSCPSVATDVTPSCNFTEYKP